MKEELISFEVAKLAKSKGFDYPTLYNHCAINGLWKPLEGKKYSGSAIPANNWNESEGTDMGDMIVEMYSAPTQSHLQKWLREVHNIHVNGDINDVSRGLYLYNLKWYDVVFKEQTGTDGMASYEEALEAGLREALKLI